MGVPQALLEARGIEKSFPGVRALRGVDLSLQAGEILAIVGENGAGKSTLAKILAGVQEFDAGDVRMEGVPVRFRSVQAAQAAGIALIHQELMLVGALDIAANISLGREPRRSGFLDREAERRLAAKHLREIGLDIDPTTRVEELALGKRQLVEIAKALAVDARILVMDEPTSSLSPVETRQLLNVIRGLSSRGVAILYISHRLSEVEALADRVLVLRDGEQVGELRGAEIEHGAMVKRMIGRDLSSLYQRRHGRPNSPPAAREALLEVRSLRTPTYPGEPVDLDVRAGEIVALAGLVGAGRTELLQCLFGVVPALGGSVRVGGGELSTGDPRAAIDAGLSLVPEDRQLHGLVVDQSVRDNLNLPTLGFGARYGLRDRAAEREVSREMVARLSIRARDDLQQARTLSGGNQQKVVLGKWLSLGPRVLLLDEPTRGVDIGSKAEIYGLLEELATRGIGILFVSSELEEILGLADRVYVMREGRLTGSLEREAMSEQAIMELATAVASG